MREAAGPAVAAARSIAQNWWRVDIAFKTLNLPTSGWWTQVKSALTADKMLCF